MKKFFLISCFLLAVSFPSLKTRAQAQNSATPSIPDNWVGEYHYSFSERGNSGYTDATEYSLTISKQGSGNKCHFTVEGPQLNNADYECRAEVKDNKLTFYFVKSLEPAGDGQVKRMRPGYVIGSLIKTPARGKTRYRLEEGRYEFAMTSTVQHPVYFKKIN